VHAQNLLVDQSTDRQTVKDVGEDLPEFDGVPAFALVVETVNSIDLSTFMIPSKQEEVFWVLDLVA